VIASTVLLFLQRQLDILQTKEVLKEGRTIVGLFYYYYESEIPTKSFRLDQQLKLRGLLLLVVGVLRL
jgi:hypothetical protein